MTASLHHLRLRAVQQAGRRKRFAVAVLCHRVVVVAGDTAINFLVRAQSHAHTIKLRLHVNIAAHKHCAHRHALTHTQINTYRLLHPAAAPMRLRDAAAKRVRIKCMFRTSFTQLLQLPLHMCAECAHICTDRNQPHRVCCIPAHTQRSCMFSPDDVVSASRCPLGGRAGRQPNIRANTLATRSLTHTHMLIADRLPLLLSAHANRPVRFE